MNNKLSCLLNEFLNYLLKERRCSPLTVQAYRRDISKLIKFSLNLSIGHLNEIDYEFFLKFLKNLSESGFGSNSTRRLVNACKTFFKFLCREEVLSSNPIKNIEPVKIWRKCHEILHYEEIVKIIESPNIESEKGLRDRAILEILYGSGIRATELCILKKCHISLIDRFLKILGKGKKMRIVVSSKISLDFTEKYWKIWRKGINEDSFAFVSLKGNQLTRRTIWDIINFYVKKCGLKKNISPHSFRRSFATHMLENGGEIRTIQELMGHSQISTTDLYLSISLKRMISEFNKYQP